MFDDILGRKNRTFLSDEIENIIDYISRNFDDQPESLVKKLIYDEIVNLFMKHRRRHNFNILYLNFEVVKIDDKYYLNPINSQTRELFKKFGII